MKQWRKKGPIRQVTSRRDARQLEQKILKCIQIHYKMQGRPQDFGLGGAKSLARSEKKRFARSAKKILNFAPVKLTLAPLKSTYCLIIS